MAVGQQDLEQTPLRARAWRLTFGCGTSGSARLFYRRSAAGAGVTARFRAVAMVGQKRGARLCWAAPPACGDR